MLSLIENNRKLSQQLKQFLSGFHPSAQLFGGGDSRIVNELKRQAIEKGYDRDELEKVAVEIYRLPNKKQIKIFHWPDKGGIFEKHGIHIYTANDTLEYRGKELMCERTRNYRIFELFAPTGGASGGRASPEKIIKIFGVRGKRKYKTTGYSEKKIEEIKLLGQNKFDGDLKNIIEEEINENNE